MSFGYGVGDLITVATIAWKISVALRSTKGASESYNSLIQEIECTAQLLYQTGKLLETAGLSASTENSISHGLSLCHSNLLRLRMIVEKYQESFETLATAPAKQKNWNSMWGLKAQLKKISWEMCEKEGVNDIRQNIKIGVDEIALILDACGLNAIGRMEGQIGRIKSQIHETCAIVKRVEAALPRDLGYWPWDHKVIYLDDALGRSIPIPFEVCLQWEHSEAGQGISWINAGQFTIKTQRHKLLFPEEWERSVKPSMTLIMSIVLESFSGRKTCPLCFSFNYPYKSKVNLEQIQCKKCFIWFSVSHQSRIAELAIAGGNGRGRERGCVPQLQGGRVSLKPEEVKYFKRLDVVSVTPKPIWRYYKHGLQLAKLLQQEQQAQEKLIT